MSGSVISKSSRGPGVFDLLLLIAATAAAMGFVRVFLPWYRPEFDSPWKVIDDMRARGPIGAPFHVFYWVQLASPFLWCWTFALIPIRLRQPRPAWRRLMRQPGAVACFSATLAVLASLATWGLLAIPSLFGSRLVADSLAGQIYPLDFRVYMFALASVGFAVASAWGVLAVSRRWRAEPSWIDRTGRVLGVVWVVTLPLNQWAALILQ